MGSLGPTEIILIILVIVLLFGAKKLPDLARGSGRALRIFKAETKGLIDDDDNNDDDKKKTDTQGRPLPPGASAAEPPPAPRPEPSREPVQDTTTPRDQV